MHYSACVLFRTLLVDLGERTQPEDDEMPEWLMTSVASKCGRGLRVALAVDTAQGAYDMRRHGHASAPR